MVRDSQGLFLHAASRVVHGLFHVRELEAMGLREALSWIKQLGFKRVIFETDLLQVVQALQNRHADFSEFGALIKDCLFLLQGEQYFSMVFTKRQNNVVAHILARNAIGACLPYATMHMLLVHRILPCTTMVCLVLLGSLIGLRHTYEALASEQQA